MEYGYARVSTREQNEQRQLIALWEFGLADSQIILDKQSGKDFDRRGYRRLLRKLKDGDTLVVKSIDRLGRNYAEILEQWRVITKEKRAAIVVLDIIDSSGAEYTCFLHGYQHATHNGGQRSIFSNEAVLRALP